MALLHIWVQKDRQRRTGCALRAWINPLTYETLISCNEKLMDDSLEVDVQRVTDITSLQRVKAYRHQSY